MLEARYDGYNPQDTLYRVSASIFYDQVPFLSHKRVRRKLLFVNTIRRVNNELQAHTLFCFRAKYVLLVRYFLHCTTILVTRYDCLACVIASCTSRTTSFAINAHKVC